MEDLYQNQPTDESEGLFDDFEVEEETEPTSEGETATETSEDTLPSEPFLEIKYDKETKGLTRDEAIELAQKGMNYDSLNNRYNALNSKIERLAKQNGMDIDQYLNGLDQMQLTYAVAKKVKELETQYPNSDKALLKQLAENEVYKTMATNIVQEQNKAQQQKDASRNALEEQVKHFEEHYPDVSLQEITKNEEVLNLMRNGYTLLESYQIYEASLNKAKAEALEKQEKITKQNEANAKRSYGNTDNAGEIESDPFLSGLFDD